MLSVHSKRQRLSLFHDKMWSKHKWTKSLTVPLSLEDSSKRPRTYPLTQSDLTLWDFPVITGVPSAQGFLFQRFTQLTQSSSLLSDKETVPPTAAYHLTAVLGGGRRLALPLLTGRFLWNLNISQGSWKRGRRSGRQSCGGTYREEKTGAMKRPL